MTIVPLLFLRRGRPVIFLMKRMLMLLLITCISTAAWALDIDPFEGPKPLAVLIQTDPWLMVIGSDTPMVAVYDDGKLIYLKNQEGTSPTYYHKQLTKEELQVVKKKLVSFGDYSTIKKYYVLENVTDQPETKIYLNLDDSELTTTVYGWIVSENNNRLPVSLKSLHEYLITLNFRDAIPWEPQYIEVMIWGYKNAPDESIHWPKEWPRLKSPRTMKRGDSYSIFLPGAELPKLRDLLKTQKPKGAVEIDGKKWAVDFRFTFPSEPVWFNAFRKAE